MFDFIRNLMKRENIKTIPGTKGMSIEQAGNYLKEKAKTLEQDTKDRMKAARPSVATPVQRKKYLKYCISLLTHPKHQDAKTLLIMRSEGMTYAAISYYSRIPEKQVIKLEKEAMEIIKDVLAAKTSTGVPIIGGRG